MSENSNSLGIFTEKITLMVCPHCDAELDVSDFDVFEDIECPSCGESLKVPGRLGNFVLVEELGRGAMGCVYLAMDESLNRLVALKVIRKEYGKDPKMLESVQREAQAMATLNHRNICQVYSFGRIEQQPFFVMELLQGERLDEMMEDGQQIDEIRALEIAIDIAHGLEAAEQAGLTHGDIKPANLLMDQKGVAKVVDFGLAKFMEPGAEIEVWGTPYYIAPEKAKKKGEDSRSDQYSLGGTIFHSLAGHPPFDAESPTKAVVAALKEDTPLIREANPEVTEKTEQVLRRMMEKNPARRYPTYSSLISDLQLALKGARDFRAEQERLAKLEEERANKKTNPLVITMLAVTAVCVLGIGAFVFLQGRGGGSAPVQRYSGPVREELAPFQRAEERNLNQAVAAVKAKDFDRAMERLGVVYNLIPDGHVAEAWAKFQEAGIRLYAQDFDGARRVLEEIAASEELIFDTRGVPDEDPRVLAQVALGELGFRELKRQVRKAQPYYAHLGEMALGYSKLLKGDRNGSVRHFRAFSEFSHPQLEWPYVLQPISKEMHIPRTMEVPAAEEAVPTGEQILNDMKQSQRPPDPSPPTSSPPVTASTRPAPQEEVEVQQNRGNNPDFFVVPMSIYGKQLTSSRKKPEWLKLSNGDVISRHVGDVIFTDAEDIHPLQSVGGSFSISTMINAPEKGVVSFVVFHFGFLDPNASTSDKASGIFVEGVLNDSGTYDLNLAMDKDGDRVFEKRFPTNRIKPGSRKVITMSWKSTGKRKGLVNLAVGNNPIGYAPLDKMELSGVEGALAVAVGGVFSPMGTLSKEQGVSVHKNVVFNRQLSQSDLAGLRKEVNFKQ